MFNDEYHGKGGSYIVDLKTGKRRPAREQNAVVISETAEVVQAEESTAAKEQTVKRPKVKEANNAVKSE